MAVRQRVRRKRRRRSEDEERTRSRPVGSTDGNRLGLAALQQQIGNQAVQRILAQRQAGEKEKTAKAPVEAGEIKIERPKIEYYDVSGSNLSQVSRQLLQDGKWYQYDYRHQTKTENGVVTRVDVVVTITLRLPRWAGPSWEQAPDADKLEWLRMMGSQEVEWEKFQELTRIPQRWLGPGWQEAPDTLKGEWRSMLQELQRRERGHVDVIYRQALVLQQRLLNQPEAQGKAIFEGFLKDLKVEREAYDRREQFAQKQKVSLGANVMVQ